MYIFTYIIIFIYEYCHFLCLTRHIFSTGRLTLAAGVHVMVLQCLTIRASSAIQNKVTQG